MPNYVPAASTLDGFADFDADFFGLSPKDAAIMDPQHRQFLEATWEAFENAGHPPENFDGRIGVFAGCGMGSYFYFNLCSNPDLVNGTGMFLLRHTGNDKDFLSTRISHVFNLKGPSIGIQTACSTSLVAVHAACQSLLLGESDMALAGGVTVELPHGRGYLHESGEILSPDGHCHAFDHRAEGTVFGSGTACVLLRRAQDAIADGDHIWAIIKGTAVNNDGSAKAGYLAPSVDGQAAAVAEAIAVAGVTSDTIGYVECHGTGTYLGDPIEVAALSQAFREGTDQTGYCRIGSVKTNIGHLDTAAGAASLIKASLALHNAEMPPSLNFEAPNPAIDFETSPFKVNDTLTAFPQLGAPRRAGVNSLGVGGTNAHAILQEAPERGPSGESDWPFQPLVVSARSKAALNAASGQLAAHLRSHPDQPLADIAYTLKEGRRAFDQRRVIVAETHEEAAAVLESGDPQRVFSHTVLEGTPDVVFMFPGGGAQYATMARDLYDTEPVFREWMDRGLDHLSPKLDYDPRAVWLPEPGEEDSANATLLRPSVQLPLILITEIALAELWMSWGVQPAALIGHSMGENAAACVAGVMTFEDAIDLVLLRGQLFDTVPAGGMLSLPLPEDKARAWLGETLDMASVNGPDLCVVSGSDADLEDLAKRLADADIEAQRVPIDIAAHSRALEPILEAFGAHLRSMTLSAPRLPVISNRTGQPLTAEEATDPDYWVGHLRNTVRFADGIAYLRAKTNRVFLECGPGRTLGSLTQTNGVPSNQVLPSLRHTKQDIADDKHFIGVLARLWALGVAVDWAAIWGDAQRHRVPLPTYPFQRQTYFIEPGAAVPGSDAAGAADGAGLPARLDEIADWGWQPVWRPSAAVFEAADPTRPEETSHKLTWAIFSDEAGLAEQAIARLRAAGHRVIEIQTGDAFARLEDDLYILAPERGRDGYDALIRDLMARGLAPQRIGHFWNVTAAESFRPGSSFFHRNLEQGFWSLLFLSQALAEEEVPGPIHVTSFTTGAASVGGSPLTYPERAAALGPVQVIPREMPDFTMSTVDLVLPEGGRRRKGASAALAALSGPVLEELMAEPGPAQIAWRGERRYQRDWRPAPLPAAENVPEVFATAADGSAPVVLVTGGLGGIGLSLAHKLAEQVPGVRLALLGRSALPDRTQWARLRGAGDAMARRIAAVEALEAAGAQVLSLQADVCNIQDMTAARDAALSEFGRVDVVIHAAGVVDDAPFLARDTGDVEAVLSPKVHGTQVLQSLFPDGSLRAIVAFSSSSTATAPVGQVDYVAANAFLDAWAESHIGGKTRVLALAWGIWSEIGMAAETVADRSAPAAPVQTEGLPLLTEKALDAEGNRVFTGTIQTEADWVLDGHRTASGQALLPGTGYLELAAEAVAGMGEAGPFALSDFYFFRPLAVADGARSDVRVRLIRSPEGYAVDIRSRVELDGRSGHVLHAQGNIEFADIAAPAPLDIAAIEARCADHRTASETGLRSPQEDHLNFGPRWRVLRAQAYGSGEGIARLSLSSEFAAEPGQGWRLHPALLDIATGWAMRLIPGWQPDRLWVPVSYERAVIHDVLPARVVSWVRGHSDNGAQAAVARFDVVLADEEGRVVAEIEGLSLRRMEGELHFESTTDRREIEFDTAGATAADGAARSLSPAEARLHAALARGIRPAEGAEAFLAALRQPLPRLTISSMPIPALIDVTAREAAAAHSADASGGAAFARPELDNDFVEPKTDIERTLVGFWQDLLGVEQVGTEDSFFDLGGHSLIAVRLFAMIRKTYKVDFPISILFEAPTIAACGQLIEDRIGPQESPEGQEAPKRAVSGGKRFKHLVPMHKSERADQPPFFLVAGMFGNVLNLRHLAQLVGRDRPFYGLQARGLYGDDAPHTTFEDAARDYIAEMRQVQSEGPWYIGGFSGGGLTAWEIARQLEAQGEEVALTVLLDTPLPMRPVLTKPDKAMIKLTELRKKGPGFLREWLESKIAWQKEKKRRRNQPEEDASHQFHNSAVENAFRAALPGYDLQARDGTTILFRPPLDLHWRVTKGAWVSSAREYVLSDNAWGPFAPNLEVIEVPGDHDSMVLEPNVRVLATHLKAAMADAEARSQTGGSAAFVKQAAE
jgi:acyl transferase domain-containing protein/thioesterase domain-containing protein/acyl carrier protein